MLFRNKYDLVMSSGTEGGPEPTFPIGRLSGTTILRSLEDRASPRQFTGSFLARKPHSDNPVSQDLEMTCHGLLSLSIDELYLCMPGFGRFGRPSKSLIIVLLLVSLFIVIWIVFSRLGWLR